MERERRGQQLVGVCAVLAAATALSTGAAAPAQETVLIRIGRPVLEESGLLRVRGTEGGIDLQAAQQLRVLMRDRTTGRSVTPSVELVCLLGALAEAFPRRTMSIVHGYADPAKASGDTSHAEGRALDFRMAEVQCDDIERFLAERPRLLARVGCFPNATSTSTWAGDVGSGSTPRWGATEIQFSALRGLDGV